MEYKDYYKLLEITRDASFDDIKKAYRRLARKYHPDVSKEAGAEARFKEINEAYEVLKDSEKRAAYDQLGANWQAGQNFRPPPGWDARTGHAGAGNFHQQSHFNTEDFGHTADGAHSEFFETLFRHFGSRAGGGGSAHFDLQGENQHAKIQIDLEDAYHGAKRQLKLSLPTEGEQSRTIEFNIPKGVRAGQQIRLAGQGMPGTGPSSKRGDLYLEVEFRPHAHYRVEQRDVYRDLPLTPWEAAIGGTVEASTPTGKVELTIPADSKAGRKLRLKGRGIPGSTPGDLYFVLQIALPTAHNDADRAAYEKFAQHFSAFKPRS